MDLFDLKANIIPHVDPNCDSLSDSINKLKMMKEMNINKVCASPEYYDSINFNIENIIIEIQKESSKLNGFVIPELISSIVYPLNINFKEIPKLTTISNTNYIFCRFPAYDLNKNFIENINYLLTQNYIPILMNLENSYLNNKLNKIKELKELGCIICVDLFLDNWSKEFTYCINKMENSDLIDFISGFSKFENLNQIINKFSSETGISKEKIENIYMNEAPNLILEV
tara:strand:+ start:1915 stop:2598 length:684 start_codon:yes stop_codon:yes gene_type:complete